MSFLCTNCIHNVNPNTNQALCAVRVRGYPLVKVYCYNHRERKELPAVLISQPASNVIPIKQEPKKPDYTAPVHLKGHMSKQDKKNLRFYIYLP